VTLFHRIAATLTIVFCTLGALAASAASAPDSRPAIVYATPAVPDNMDPDKDAGSVSTRINANLYDTLIQLNPQAGRGPRLIPDLATSWTVAADGKSIDFQLRPHVLFHNGKTMTADDVKFSLERAINPKTKDPFATYMRNLVSVEVLSPTSVRLHLSEPWIGTLDGLAAGGQIIPKAYVEQVGDDGFAAHPIGTGPFVFVDRQIGDSITFKAFDQYFAGKPAISKVVWRSVPDPNSRVSLLTSGGADLITDVPSSLVDSVRKSGAQVDYLIGPVQRFVVINTLKGPPLADKRVRMALNIALDRNAIFTAVFGRSVPQLEGPLAPQQIGGGGKLSYPYDPVRAKALLAEAGYPNGFSTELIYPPGRYTGDEELLPTLASYWKRVGITVALKATDYNEWLESVHEKTYAGLADFSKNDLPVSDPFSAFDRHIRCGASYSAYCNKQLDGLIDTVNAGIDVPKLTTVFRKAQQIAHDDAVQVFLYQEPGIIGVRKGLQWNSNYSPDTGIGWYVLR
jgi:peptide/nickel transport system substrate-binding protein